MSSTRSQRKCHKSDTLHSIDHCGLEALNLSEAAEDSEPNSIPIEIKVSEAMREDCAVGEADHQQDSDFSGDETDDQWTQSSVNTWFTSTQKDAGIKRPGIDPSESEPNEDDASVSNMSISSFINAFAFGYESTTASVASSKKRKDSRNAIGDVTSLLDGPHNLSADDEYDHLFVNSNGGESLDGFSKQRRPDPPGSVSSRSDDQSAQVPSSSDSASASYLEAYQTRLDQRLEGGFLSEQLSFFLRRNNQPNQPNSPPQHSKPHLIKSTVTLDTTVDTTSDTSMDKTASFGNEKWSIVEELDKRPCVRSWKAVLCFHVLLIAIVTATTVSLSSAKVNIVSMDVAGAATKAPTLGPSSIPSSFPSDMPSLTPSSLPTTSLAPSVAPSLNPSSAPSQNPTYEEVETTFYAIGDVPYRYNEKWQLKDRVRELPEDAEFMIHLGDIRSSGSNGGMLCPIEDYQGVHNTLRLSKVPVFIIPGDNEWNDCPNHVEAKRFWRANFHEFDKHWNHTFQVVRHPVEPENFYFVHKRTLYFGLTLLGGRVRDRGAFDNDLRNKFEYVKEMIDQHVVAGDAVNVVIFGHAFPVPHHDPFFVPMRQYIDAHLNNKVPIMYLNGDYHFFQDQKNYLGLSNFQRLQVAQGTAQPPLKIAVTASNDPMWNATEAFSHDRMLWLKY